MQLSKDSAVALGVVILVLLFVAASWVVRTHTPQSLSQLSAQGPVQQPSEPYGTVTSVSGNTVVLSMQAPFMAQPIEYTLQLTASTSIIRHLNKSPAQFAQELAAFKAGQASTSPIGYSIAPASMSDIMPGAIIQAPDATKQNGIWYAPEIIIDAPATSTPTSTSAM